MAFEEPIRRAAPWHAYIQQGSTFQRTITVPGLDMTDLSFRGQIRRNHRSAEVLAEYTVELVEPDTVRVTLDAAATADLPARRRLVHDVEAYNPDESFVARILEGRVAVSPEVTRPVI